MLLVLLSVTVFTGQIDFGKDFLQLLSNKYHREMQ